MKLLDILTLVLFDNGGEGWPKNAVSASQDRHGDIVFTGGDGVSLNYTPFAEIVAEELEKGSLATVTKRDFLNYLENRSFLKTDGSVGPGNFAIYKDPLTLQDRSFLCSASAEGTCFGFNGALEPVALRTSEVKFIKICQEIHERRARRVEAAQAMCNLAGNGVTVNPRTGFGSAWLELYDAIEAGMIPYIKVVPK